MSGAFAPRRPNATFHTCEACGGEGYTLDDDRCEACDGLGEWFE